MAQYHFIGGDGKPYGPYTLEQMKEHQAGNRLNAKTQVSVDGGDWQPAGKIPELATDTSAVPPAWLEARINPDIPQDDAAGNAQAMVNGPSIFMMVLAIICIPLTLLGLAMNLFAGSLGSILKDLPPELADQLIRDGAIGIAQNGLSLVANIVILIGAIKMRKCQSYGLAMTASILCILCDWGCCCLGLGAGIWSLVVLSKPEVKAAFQ